MSTILSENASLVKLKKRISLLEKAVNLLLFGEYVEIPEDEKQETLSRLMDYIEGREEEFIDFEKFEAIVRDENS